MRVLDLRAMKTFTALCAMLCLCAVLEAHSVRIFGAQDGDKIVGKVYFVGGGVGENVDVVVAADDGTRIATVKTNEKGEFSFSPGAREGELKLSVDTGDGHSAKTSVSYGIAGGNPSKAQTPSSPAPAPTAQAPSNVPSAALDAKAIEEIVDKLIAKRMLPLQESIERYEGLIRFRDILGGIGYILGIAGIASFFISRRPAKSKGAGEPK